MKYFFIYLFCLFLTEARAQSFEKINRDAVKHAVTDSTAPTFYPTLLQRFNDFDTTLTGDDYRLLYYGFVFQPQYSAYADNKSGKIADAISKSLLTDAIMMADSVLEKTPISLQANYQKGLALYMKDSISSPFLAYADRYNNLMAAILSTGDGLACETAFKTIFVADEYDVIYKHFEMDRVTGQSLHFPCDRMGVTPNDYFTQSSMWFDTSETFLSMNKMLGGTEAPDKNDKRKKKRNKD